MGILVTVERSTQKRIRKNHVTRKIDCHYFQQLLRKWNARERYKEIKRKMILSPGSYISDWSNFRPTWDINHMIWPKTAEVARLNTLRYESVLKRRLFFSLGNKSAKHWKSMFLNVYLIFKATIYRSEFLLFQIAHKVLCGVVYKPVACWTSI